MREVGKSTWGALKQRIPVPLWAVLIAILVMIEDLYRSWFG